MAALGVGLTQVSNRKANQVFDAYRTAFGLLLTLLLVLLARAAAIGELELVAHWSRSSTSLPDGRCSPSASNA